MDSLTVAPELELAKGTHAIQVSVCVEGEGARVIQSCLTVLHRCRAGSPQAEPPQPHFFRVTAPARDVSPPSPLPPPPLPTPAHTHTPNMHPLQSDVYALGVTIAAAVVACVPAVDGPLWPLGHFTQPSEVRTALPPQPTHPPT